MPAKIVIDTDPGVDDVLAILLALASPEVEVALITLVFGNTHAPQTFANLLKLYYNLGRELDEHPEARLRYPGLGSSKTRVAVGRDDPIGGDKHVATYFHGRDGLSNISETHPEFNVPEGQDELLPGSEHPHLDILDRDAADAILDLLKEEPAGTVTIVALGPLTNVAWAHRKDPETFARVREVVWMGGALDVPGNTSPVAEFNCFADPYAFDALVEGVKAGVFHFTFAPLDVTTPHTIPFSDLLHPSMIEGNDPAAYPPPTRLQAFTTAFLLRVRWLQQKFGHGDAMEMHDPVAIWYAIEHAAHCAERGPSVASPADGAAPGWQRAHRSFGVERRGELTRGMCVVDRRGTGETSADRTQDASLTSGVGHLSLNGTGKNKAIEHRDAEAATSEKGSAARSSAEGNSNGHGNANAAPAEPRLPRMITHTPGPEVLRRKLLSRVFGTAV